MFGDDTPWRNSAKSANQSLIIKVVCNLGSLKHAVACRRFQKVSLNHDSSCGNSINRSSILCALCRIKQRTDSENKLLIRQRKCDIQKYNKLTKILHTYVKFWSILYINIMCLYFVSLCWQSAFVTCQKRQNVGKFEIKHSILTKKGLNLALFWSKLYKHIILQRIFFTNLTNLY